MVRGWLPDQTFGKSRFLGLFWDDRSVSYLDVGIGYKKAYNRQNVLYSTLKTGGFFPYEIYTQCLFVLSFCLRFTHLLIFGGTGPSLPRAGFLSVQRAGAPL